MKKKKLMAILYILILLILVFTIYLEVKELKNKPTKTVDELIDEEINERYNNNKVDYYTFDEVNEQKYLDSSENNNSSEKIEQKGNNKSDKVIEKQSNKTSTDSNNNLVEKQTNNTEPKDKQPEEQVVTETTEEQPKVEIVEDDSVDPNGFDYHIHKGRIDCSSADGCMDISIPIQLKYKKSISNVNYIEVIAKSDKTLGYFIDYVFVEYNYGNVDKCNEIGNSIKTKLSDRVTGFTCSPEGILKINKDY